MLHDNSKDTALLSRDAGCEKRNVVLTRDVVLQLAFSGWPSKHWSRQDQEGSSQQSEGSSRDHSWNNLPRDLLLRAVDRLDQPDRLLAACTCAAWRQVIGSNTQEASFTWAGRQEIDNEEDVPLVSSLKR